MNTLLASFPLSSLPPNSSQIFSTHLTLSINYSLNLLILVIGAQRNCSAVTHEQTKNASGQDLFRLRRGCAYFNISLHHPRQRG